MQVLTSPPEENDEHRATMVCEFGVLSYVLLT